VAPALYYSVIQVVPDMARGERINVGVVAWDDRRREGAVRFSRQRQRLRALGVLDTTFLTNFEKWLMQALDVKGPRLFSLPDQPGDRWSLEQMQSAAAEWAGMVQMNDPHPSRGNSAGQLAQQVYERVVHVPSQRLPGDIDRKTIRRSVARSVRGVLTQRYGGEAPLAVHVTQEIGGDVDSHVFDVVLANHTTRSVLITPNLADPRTIQVRRDLDAAAWSIQDVHSKSPAIAFAIVRDKGSRPALLDRVDAIARRLPVTPIERPEISNWAVQEAERARGRVPPE
jgi:hypothetical protein